MDKIFITINNNEEVIILPVTPKEYEITEPWDIQEINGLQGPLNLIQNKKLATLSLESFFPVRDYPFLQSRKLWGMEYVETIQRWRQRRIPVRVVIIGDGIAGSVVKVNKAFSIESFNYTITKNGDIDYSLDLREFRFVEVG